MVNQGMKREIMEKRKKIAGILCHISHTQYIRQDIQQALVIKCVDI